MAEDDRAGNRLGRAPIRPILVPLAQGAMRAGVEQGAEVLETALRARLQAHQRPELLARLRPTETVACSPLAGDAGQTAPGGALHVDEIATAGARAARRVRDAIGAGELALTLGGDHALSVGTVAGASAAARRLAVLWVDAHADLNAPATSPSGHVHGMPLAVALGRGSERLTGLCGRAPKVRPEDTYLLGVRDLDPAERVWLHEGRLHCATMADIDDAGLEATLRSMLDEMRRSGVDAVHVSFDVDALDPLLLPGTGTRAWGGLTFREAARLLRLLRGTDLPIRSLDWVELNPSLDPTGASTEVAAALLAVAVGEDLL
ncbi:MAG TPA: arginase [Thermomicrobiaceae bacterium]|nr:arginase [Thermomicrobiaceae bacterium]